MLARELLGKEVIGRGGTKIGTVDDMIIDTNTWQVTSMTVKLEGPVAQEFNLKKRFRSTHLPLSVDHIQGVSDRIVLRINVDDLLNLVPSSEKPGSTP